MKRHTALALAGFLTFAVSAYFFYGQLFMATLVCRDRHQTPECEANYVHAYFSEAGLLIGVVLGAVALWQWRRARVTTRA
ncbi:MAG: hypothetical protein QM817_06100 [Archangium sp.]